MGRLDPWYERFFDGLYQQVLPATFTEARTRKQLAIVRRLLHLRKGHRVLDIPCGMARLTRHSHRLIALASRPPST
jgi:cyclopropane fatty-acyl-phospholipid synthase-like methyltransferase